MSYNVHLETLVEVYKIQNLGDILNGMGVDYSNGEIGFTSDFKEIKQELRYPNTRFKIDFSSLFKKREFVDIFFDFKDYYRYKIEIEIEVEDKEQTSLRPLLDNTMKQKGDKIKPVFGHYSEYFLEFEKQIFVDEDKKRNCINYRNKNTKSYKECDNIFIRKYLDGMGLKNVIPVWATDSIDEVTEYMAVEMDEQSEVKELQVFSGVNMGDCKDPCTSTSIDTRLLSMSESSGNTTIILISISEYITIEETVMVNFNFLTTLSFLGANMGLWLGLGVVQFMEVFVNCLSQRIKYSFSLQLWEKCLWF